MHSMKSGVLSLEDFSQQIRQASKGHAVTAFKHGTLDVKLSLPTKDSAQTVHAQDELYFVIRGKGILLHAGEKTSFSAGDVLFVAAGVEHDYVEISDDLALWRIFYGQEGGEKA